LCRVNRWIWLFLNYFQVLNDPYSYCWKYFHHIPQVSRLKVSWLPPKSAPLLVQAAFGGRRHWLSSHRHSIFQWSLCFVLFPAHLVFIPQSHCMYLFLCSRSCLCVKLFVLRVNLWRARLVCLYRDVYEDVFC
jgi:hypothetical protein